MGVTNVLNSLTITNGNDTGPNAGGGGILSYYGTVTVNQSTVSGNSANDDGGGIFNENPGTLNLTNSIVCSNTASSGPNIFGSFSGANNLVNQNALLAALGNYGGPTPTMPPLPGSPAIDGCTSGTAFTTDQRGFARPVGNFADIGAVESGNAIPGYTYGTVVNTTADFLNGSETNLVSLRNAVVFGPTNATITFDPSLSDQTILLTSGQLLLDKNLTIDGSSLASAVQLNGNNASRIFTVTNGATVELTSLTITNGNANSDPVGGGGILNRASTLTLNRCTVVGNTANSSGVGGGGVANYQGTVTLNNSTFTGNQADSTGNGGGGIWNYTGPLTVNNCTIVGNQAVAGYGDAGGGILNFGTLNLTNSIVCSNNAPTSVQNIYGTIDSGANNLVDVNALLAPLGNYGGPTRTMPPLPGSPAIDAGAATTLTTDQRGFARLSGAQVDIGAVEVGNPVNVTVDPAKGWIGFMNVYDLLANGGGFQFGSPWATADLNAFFTGPTLTLTPNTSIDRDEPNNSYWFIGGSGAGNKTMDANMYVEDNALTYGQTVIFSGYCVSNTLVSPYTSVVFIKDFVPDYSSSVSTNVALVTGQPFTLSLPTGAGHHIQYGFETVGPNARVATVAAMGKVILSSRAPTTQIVTTNGNNGPGSLRQVVADAVYGDTIQFAPGLSGSNIVLTSGQLTLNKNLTIDGSALPNGLTLDGNGVSRIFEVLSGQTVVLTALTLTNGYESFGGGGIWNAGDLTVNRCTLSGNSAGVLGGGIFSNNKLTLNQCTLFGNSAQWGGGVLNEDPNGQLFVNQSTLSGNTAVNSGGGIRSDNPSIVQVNNSIVAGNSPDNITYEPGVTPNYSGVNLTNGIPQLAALGNYSGPTPTMPPLTGSPAINGCTNGTSFATDQRGSNRIVGAFADIGAVEVQVVIGTTPFLTGLTRLGDGNFQFSFTNLTGASFTVFASTNVASPLNEWSNLGAPAESPAGTFQFTDPQATNYTERFYRVTSP